MHILLDIHWLIFFLRWAVITILHFKVFYWLFTLHFIRMRFVANLKLRNPNSFFFRTICLFLLERIDGILYVVVHCLLVYFICTTLRLQRQENNKWGIIFKCLNDVDLSELWWLSFEYLCISDSNEFKLFTVLAHDGAVHRFESCVNRGLSNQQLLKKTKLDKISKNVKKLYLQLSRCRKVESSSLY